VGVLVSVEIGISGGRGEMLMDNSGFQHRLHCGITWVPEYHTLVIPLARDRQGVHDSEV
jgi:hypothetical protein